MIAPNGFRIDFSLFESFAPSSLSLLSRFLAQRCVVVAVLAQRCDDSFARNAAKIWSWLSQYKDLLMENKEMMVFGSVNA
jgi:hypothetical protein